MGGFPVHAISHNGIAAIISQSGPLSDYGTMSKPKLVQMLSIHQQVTEKVMQQLPQSLMLPVKFGTLLSREEVSTLLAQFHADFNEAFQRLNGTVEVELVVTCQPERIFAEIAQEPTIVQLRQAAAGRTEAEVRQLQIIVGQLVKQAYDARKAAYKKLILEQLSGVASDVEINPVQHDQVVANIAFLLPIDKQAEFDRQVEEIDAQLDGQLNFKIVGPLPPYSFSTIDVQKIEYGTIYWAQEELSIGESATASEIQSAYRQQAKQYHPDVVGEQPEAAARFADIKEAYDLLKSYHALQYGIRQPAVPKEEFRCAFKGAENESILMINIRRSSELAHKQ